MAAVKMELVRNTTGCLGMPMGDGAKGVRGRGHSKEGAPGIEPGTKRPARMQQPDVYLEPKWLR